MGLFPLLFFFPPLKYSGIQYLLLIVFEIYQYFKIFGQGSWDRKGGFLGRPNLKANSVRRMLFCERFPLVSDL